MVKLSIALLGVFACVLLLASPYLVAVAKDWTEAIDWAVRAIGLAVTIVLILAVLQ